MFSDTINPKIFWSVYSSIKVVRASLSEKKFLRSQDKENSDRTVTLWERFPSWEFIKHVGRLAAVMYAELAIII